jgi:hypothetical protein
MIKKVPIYKLRPAEKLWLQEVYNHFQKNQRVTYRQVWKKLNGKIPSNFRPVNINKNLISADGEHITLLGIMALLNHLDILDDINKIVNQVKRIILEKPEIEEIDVRDISRNLTVTNTHVGLLLYLIRPFGSFWRSATTENNTYAFKSIEIGKESGVFYQYINFESIEQLIVMYLNEQAYSDSESREKTSKNLIQRDLSIHNSNDLLTIKPLFKPRVSRIDKKLCFVLMPFVEEWSHSVYNNLIRKNVEGLKLRCLRADDLTGTNIVDDIWSYINQAGIIIADVTGPNPNVMYELGIAHTIGKPTILITQNINSIPFDFRHLRHIEYRDNIEGSKIFSKKIKQVIKDVYKEYYSDIDNMFTA